MRKVIFSIVLLACFTNSNAQDLSQRQILLQSIERLDSIMDNISEEELPDSLRAQISIFHLLTNVLTEEINDYSVENQKLQNELHKYLILTSSDTLIFHQDFKDFNDIPICLQERIDIINSIIELREQITAVESLAQDLEQKLGNSPIAYAAIRERIENDLNAIQTHIHEIKSMNLSTLSEIQQNYFRPGLTERYNNFKKYF